MLGLPKEEYWIVAGGAMVLHGIKKETRDIDLGCSRKLADRLEANGHLPERMADGSRRFVINSEIEVFEKWLFDRVEYIDGIPTISLLGLIMMKQSLGREKILQISPRSKNLSDVKTKTDYIREFSSICQKANPSFSYPIHKERAAVFRRRFL